MQSHVSKIKNAFELQFEIDILSDHDSLNT